MQHARVAGKKSADAVLMHIITYQMSEIFTIHKCALNVVNGEYKWD